MALGVHRSARPAARERRVNCTSSERACTSDVSEVADSAAVCLDLARDRRARSRAGSRVALRPEQPRRFHMSNKSEHKKLTLHSETIRTLSGTELHDVNGGTWGAVFTAS